MLIKYIEDEDFVNYKKPSMFIGTAYCDFKCEKECGVKGLCQNGSLMQIKAINIDDNEIVDRYIVNPFTEAVVIGGLEPFDQFEELFNLIKCFRHKTSDEIVIYTGFYENEILDKLYKLQNNFNNLIVKFGRFLPNETKHFDDVLGVYLASSNQKAKKIS